MSRAHVFARGLVVGSLLSVGIGLLTYLLFEFYCDGDEGNSKNSNKYDRDTDAEGKARRKKAMLNSSDKAIVDVCLSDITSAVSAIASGTSSIELCANRSEGGVTPYIGLVEDVVRMAQGKDIQVHVIIRPRTGNHVYSAVEFDIMVQDIVAVKNAGAHGIVVGILLENGDVDDDRMAVIRSVSIGMFLTFHRPVDVSMDTKWPTESVIKLDSNNVITSQHPPVPVPVPILTSAQLGATPLLSTPKAEEDTGGLISKATSADFSDDFLDSPPKAEPQVAIETSYVHVDIDLPNSKKKSWLWRA